MAETQPETRYCQTLNIGGGPCRWCRRPLISLGPRVCPEHPDTVKERTPETLRSRVGRQILAVAREMADVDAVICRRPIEEHTHDERAQRAMLRKWREALEAAALALPDAAPFSRDELTRIERMADTNYQWHRSTGDKGGAADAYADLAAKCHTLAEATPASPCRKCVVCREDEPLTGQIAGAWASVHGPGYVVCKRCREAGRTAKIEAYASHRPAPPLAAQGE